jgi:hypothetical protein
MVQPQIIKNRIFKMIILAFPISDYYSTENNMEQFIIQGVPLKGGYFTGNKILSALPVAACTLTDEPVT